MHYGTADLHDVVVRVSIIGVADKLFQGAGEAIRGTGWWAESLTPNSKKIETS
jgi:hypothetical protein